MSGFCAATLLILCLAPSSGSAGGLDWEVREEPASAPVQALRNVRDGVVGSIDTVSDLQLALFAEASLLLSTGVMAGSDLLGLIDDNAATQHVFKGVASKSLSKTAFLLHVVGSEAILGSHGLEAESYLEQQLTDLNPLLADASSPAGIPLLPLSFFEEGLVHPEVYRFRVPLLLAASALVAGVVVRPLGNLATIVGAQDAGRRLESTGNRMVRAALP